MSEADWSEFTLRIGLAPGAGIDYVHDPDSGILMIRIQGSNPMLVMASGNAFLESLKQAINTYRQTWRDRLPALSPHNHIIEVDEEVFHFLGQRAKEGVSANEALRFLLFGEAPPTRPDLEPASRSIDAGRRGLHALPSAPPKEEIN